MHKVSKQLNLLYLTLQSFACE